MTSRRRFLQTLAALPPALSFRRSLAAIAPDPTRLALVIGNSSYAAAPLVNPANDARAIGGLLAQAGFSVDSHLDATRTGMLAAIERFGAAAKRPETRQVVFYYAGHGAQLDWRNYLLPVDAQVEKPEHVKQRCVDLGLLLGQFIAAKDKTFIVILDACRNNPFGAGYRPEQKGLSQFDAPVGSLLAYATSPGNVASDGEGANGLYTENLVRELSRRATRLEDALKRVRLNVRLASRGAQVPWETTSLESDVFLFSEGQKKPSEAELEQQVEADVGEWSRIKSSKNVDDWVAYLRTYPNGRFAEIAQMRLARLLEEVERRAIEKRQREESRRIEEQKRLDAERIERERQRRAEEERQAAERLRREEEAREARRRREERELVEAWRQLEQQKAADERKHQDRERLLAEQRRIEKLEFLTRQRNEAERAAAARAEAARRESARIEAARIEATRSKAAASDADERRQNQAVPAPARLASGTAAGAPAIDIRAGVPLPPLLVASANPYSAGRYPLARVFTVGDAAVIRLSDALTGIEESTVTRRVTLVDHDADRVEYNRGAFVTDLMGNPIKLGPIEFDTPVQWTPAEFQVGRKWTAAFRRRVDGRTTNAFYDIQIAARETLAVPAGRFDCFRIEGNGWNLTTGARLELRIWLVPGINTPIRRDFIIRARNGQFIQTERSELVALRQQAVGAL